MDSRLVVLGSSGAWPGVGHACSGYVLEHLDFRVVLDLGYGTAAPLLAHLDSSAGDGVDAVIVSHAHADHMSDLHAFFRSRYFGARTAPAIPTFAPTQVREQLVATETVEGPDDGRVDRVFAWHTLPAATYPVGPWRLESADLPHYVTNAGVRLVSEDLVVAYTGDTGPSPLLAELGRDADRTRTAREVAQVYDGEVLVAQEGMVVRL